MIRNNKFVHKKIVGGENEFTTSTSTTTDSSWTLRTAENAQKTPTRKSAGSTADILFSYMRGIVHEDARCSSLTSCRKVSPTRRLIAPSESLRNRISRGRRNANDLPHPRLLERIPIADGHNAKSVCPSSPSVIPWYVRPFWRGWEGIVAMLDANVKTPHPPHRHPPHRHQLFSTT